MTYLTSCVATALLILPFQLVKFHIMTSLLTALFHDPGGTVSSIFLNVLHGKDQKAHWALYLLILVVKAAVPAYLNQAYYYLVSQLVELHINYSTMIQASLAPCN